MTAITADGARAPGRFFANSALLMAVIVVASFPLTYYGPMITGARRFDALRHLHGLACFSWIGLYAWQCLLVARGKVARHRELGLLGFALTGVLPAMGVWMAQRAAHDRLAAGAEFPYGVSLFNLVDIGLFTGLMVASVVLVTRHREWHRRLTFAAALCLVSPAASRWTLKLPIADGAVLDLVAYLIFDLAFVALALHDRRVLGRVHPATWVIVAALLPIQVAAVWGSRSEVWNALAPSLLG